MTEPRTTINPPDPMPIDAAMLALHEAILAVNQHGQAAANELAEVQDEMLAYIKANNPILFARYEVCQSRIARVDALYAHLGEVIGAWNGNE